MYLFTDVMTHAGALLASAYNKKCIFKVCNISDQLVVWRYSGKAGTDLCTYSIVEFEDVSKYRKLVLCIYFVRYLYV